MFNGAESWRLCKPWHRLELLLHDFFAGMLAIIVFPKNGVRRIKAIKLQSVLQFIHQNLKITLEVPSHCAIHLSSIANSVASHAPTEHEGNILQI